MTYSTRLLAKKINRVYTERVGDTFNISKEFNTYFVQCMYRYEGKYNSVNGLQYTL